MTSNIILFNKDKIENEIKRLEREVYALECSDNFLFTNGNGNYQRYKDMKNKIKELKEELNKFSNKE